MEWMMGAWQFLMANVDKITGATMAFLALAEAITRLTPTETDDGFVERMGAVIRKILDFLKVPNVKKER